MRHLMWLFLFLSFHHVKADDGSTLLDIKRSLRDPENLLYDWKVTSNYCTWRGVVCDNVTLNVVSLKLPHLNLDGVLSPAIGQLKGLITLILKRNGLSGQIPDEIGDCSALEKLDLSFNELHGHIPLSISKLKQLRRLVLENNQLIGPIPSIQMPTLVVLNLALNKLSGEIPWSTYRNKALKYLRLRDNKLSGSLSPDMCLLTSLWSFDVHNNSLTGSIPQNIGNCTALSFLGLSYNNLTGEIPSNICFLPLKSLTLLGNRFSGQIPSAIGLMQTLNILDLSGNRLSGTIPSTLGNLTSIGRLYLQGNELTGSIAPELGNMTKLRYLVLNDNKLTGHIPPELGKLTKLLYLNFSNNHLDGPIPANLSSCTNLNILNVHGNKLDGTIPPALQKLNFLSRLNLASNYLEGPIPIELSHVGNLDTMDLSNNRINGSIPSQFGSLKYLLKLNLSKNEIYGHLPAEFGNLTSIEEIDVSWNHLSGPIPQELGQLQNLFVLKLEYNNLSGNVMSLASCISLNVLNVSYNNLSVNIPAGNNFSRFSPESFIGNPGLCAPCYPSHERKARISSAAICGIALGALVILVVIVVAASWPWDPAPVNCSSPKLVIHDMNMANCTYEDVMRITENFSDKFIIGRGGSSTVYRCMLENRNPVAIKRVQSDNSGLFTNELNALRRINHPNIVGLQAYCHTPTGLLIFYDLMENGSLLDVLCDPTKKKSLNWATRIRIAVESAQGLAYLHNDCIPPIVHRDVKSANIVLDKDFVAHVTDFGVAKGLRTSQTHTSTAPVGTTGYFDPEYYRTLHLTNKSDVYSFGIVLLELLMGKQAFHDEVHLRDLFLEETSDAEKKATENAVNDALMGLLDPEIKETIKNVGEVKQMFQIARECTLEEGIDRPNMREVVKRLESVRLTVEVEQAKGGPHNRGEMNL